LTDPIIPELKTDRLILRGHRIDDFEDCVSLWSDPVVMRFLGGRPFTPEEVWSRILRYAGHWSMLGFGYWIVSEKSTGRFVGGVGFSDFRREIRPSLAGLPELGWILASGSHGQGFATEAATAALAWGETHFEPTRTTCLIHPDNKPSLRVAEKCGYNRVGLIQYKDSPVALLDRPLGTAPEQTGSLNRPKA